MMADILPPAGAHLRIVVHSPAERSLRGTCMYVIGLVVCKRDIDLGILPIL